MLRLLRCERRAAAGILRRNLRRLCRGTSAQQRPRKGRGEYIARAIAAAIQLFMAIIAAFPIVPQQKTRFPGFHSDAGQDDRLPFGRRRACGKLLGIRQIELLPVVHPGQQRGLRYIWKNIVRLGAERPHRVDDVRAEAAVKPPIICHRRVDDQNAARPQPRPDHVPHERDLPRGGEIAGVDRRKIQSFALPVCLNAGDVVRQVAEGVALKAPGVRREHRRRQCRRLVPAGGQDRQRHS